MRCPDCNKFVGFDTDTDPEDNVEVDAEGNISGSVRIVNTCAECGTELKDATFDVGIDFTKQVKEHLDGWNGKGEHNLEIEAELSRTDRMQNKTRTGKLIRNPRYMKHMYGAEGTFTVRCSCEDDWSDTVSWSDEVPGSGMEELA